MTDDLAEGWTIARMDQVCDINPRKPPADLLSANAPVSFVPMAAVDEIAGAIAMREDRPYGEVRKSYTAFAEGDVILAKITPCFENGKAAIATGLTNQLGFGSSEFHVLRPRSGIISEYIYHFVRQPRFRDEARGHMAGTAGQERVPVEYLRDHQLSLAPTAEQRRIVEKVEALLARVGVARERLERVPKLLKRFRQAVLAAACDGRLTEGWRSQQERMPCPVPVLSSVVTPTPSEVAQEFPAGWRVSAMGTITRNYDGKRVPVRANDREKRKGPYPYYGASGIIDTIDGFLFDGKYLLIAEDGANLLSRSTPIAFLAEGKFWVNNHAHVVQPLEGIDIEFLNLAVNALDLQSIVTGSAQPKLTQAALNELLVVVPPPEEQREIVRRVGALFAMADTVERRVGGALLNAARLSQSILSRAFAGELVPTEAELARAEGRTYQAAAELLARIRSEREGAGATLVRRAVASRKSPALGGKSRE